MKLTKNQLKEIIKEELNNLAETEEEDDTPDSQRLLNMGLKPDRFAALALKINTKKETLDLFRELIDQITNVKPNDLMLVLNMLRKEVGATKTRQPPEPEATGGE